MTIRLPASAVAKLKRLAEADNRSMAYVIRMLIERAVGA